METGTCLRCGASYEADATVCYSCGAPIGETKTPTQPVRAVKSPTPDAPEPEPVPSPAPVSATAPASSPAPAVASRPARPAAPAPSTAPAAHSRSRVPVALAVSVLILLVLGGAAYAVRAITAPPPVTSKTTYHDPQRRFSFVVPTLWQVTTTAAGATLSDGTGTSTATVSVAGMQTPGTAADEADRLATQMGLHADAPQTIGGQSWEQRSGQVTGSDGAVRQVAVLVTVYGGQLYTIELASPVATYNSINALVYQPLLASFAFG